MKKIILSLAVASLVFASCSKEQTVSEISRTPGIGFDLSTGKTRASVAAIGTIEGSDGFGVYATKAVEGVQTMAIDNKIYKYDDEWKWADTSEPTPEWQKWPDADTEYPMNFYAYYPDDATRLDGDLEYEYTISATMADQLDLLAANKLNVTTRPSSSNVNIDFQHILSQVNFKVLGGKGMTVIVQSIAVKNANKTATFNYGASPMVWKAVASPALLDYPYLTKAGITTIEGDGENAQAITGTSGSLMLLPQDFSTTAWVPVPANNVEPTTQSYIEVVYRMVETEGGKDVVGYTDAIKYPDYGTTGSGTTGPLFVKVGYPLDTDWTMGTSYTYTIYLGTPDASGGNLTDEDFIDAGGNPDDKLPVVDPTTEKPITPEDPIVKDGPIGFEVSVTPWPDTPTAETLK